MTNEKNENRDVLEATDTKIKTTKSNEPKKTKNKLKKQKTVFGIASISFLVAVLDRLGELVYAALIDGFFGKLFSSYSKLQNKFKTGLCGKFLFGGSRVKKIIRKIRMFLASNIESGFFSVQTRKAIKYFVSLPLNSYGNFFLFFGIYVVVVYFIKMLIPIAGGADQNYLLTGIITALIAIPMMFSKSALSICIKNSVIGKMIFQGAFGFSDESFAVRSTKSKGNIMLLLGLLAGLSTFFIPPLNIIVTALVIILLCIIATTPEVGVLLTIVSIPILSFVNYPTILLCILIFTTAFFYLLKLIRGKRVFKLEILDAFVLLFGIFILCSNVFSAGKESGTSSVLVTVVLLWGYFLLVNLMRTEKWIMRCIFALVGSAAFVSVIGIFEYIFGTDKENNAWLDTSLFSNIKLRSVSLFENPNVLSVFLVMIFPFALSLFLLAKKRNEKILMFIVAIALVVCTVFTWSRGAWLGLILGILIFFIIYSKRTFRLFGVLFLAIPLLPIIIPDSIINRFLSITNLLDSSISYRIYTWKGTAAVIGDYFLSGIGFGNDAFQNVYPYYAYSGMESAAHSHSLFLQILVATGIFGLIIFAIIIFLNFQKCFEYIKAPENRGSKIYVAAAVSAIASALIMGVFDYIWYNYRVFYIFWIILAIGCAFVRVGNSEISRKYDISDEHIR